MLSILVNYPNSSDQFTRNAITTALARVLPHHHATVDTNTHQSEEQQVEQGDHKFIQISDYDLIDWNPIQRFPQSNLVNAYPIRKALIRKNYLARTLHFVGKEFVPETWTFELRFVDELDELWLDELYELGQALEHSSRLQSDYHDWFILKPALAERGQGIRLFNTKQALVDIFDEFESDDEEEEENQDQPVTTKVSASRMRMWIVQRYISRPLLLGPSQKPISELSKHHLRVYVLAVGALSVYVYKDILALSAAAAYKPPSSSTHLDLSAHLTNTCLQATTSPSSPHVALLSSLVEYGLDLDRVETQVDEVIAKTFMAATRQPIHFQTRPNCWEIFGVDLLVDEDMKVWLLEINACPDFAQTGEALSNSIIGLFESSLQIAVKPFLGEADPDLKNWEIGTRQERFGFRKCLEVDVMGGGLNGIHRSD